MAKDKSSDERSVACRAAISFYALDPRHWSEEVAYPDATGAESGALSPTLDDQRRLFRVAVETYGLKERYFAHITGEDGDQ